MPRPTEEEFAELEGGLYLESDGAAVVVFGKDAKGQTFDVPLTPTEAELFAHELIVRAFHVRRATQS